MADTERAIGITAKLYQIRSAAKFLWAAEYNAKMAEWSEAIEMVANRKGLDHLKAAILLGEKAQEQGADATFLTIMAAYVEMTEPSKVPNHV